MASTFSGSFLKNEHFYRASGNGYTYTMALDEATPGIEVSWTSDEGESDQWSLSVDDLKNIVYDKVVIYDNVSYDVGGCDIDVVHSTSLGEYVFTITHVTEAGAAWVNVPRSVLVRFIEMCNNDLDN